MDRVGEGVGRTRRTGNRVGICPRACWTVFRRRARWGLAQVTEDKEGAPCRAVSAPHLTLGTGLWGLPLPLPGP